MNADKGDSKTDFPLATTRTSKFALGSLSRVWLVTLACVALAIGLAWYSMDSPGPEIVIHFAEGHGLKEGDAVRYRGIDLGHVTNISLSEELSSIDVVVQLDAAAADIASEGSRFWIVRPQIDLRGVSGLETAVGAKYIAVLPGKPGNRQLEFDGLPISPPESVGQNGIEIVLRGDDRYGVNPGSPVTWRGVEVGQVISSSISADALHVDTRVRLRHPHQRLLSRRSKFWVTSGVHMDFGVTGVQVDTETLEEIARGGVAFITPGGSSQEEEIHAGEMFTLYEKPQKKWLESPQMMHLLKGSPPPIASVVAQWKQKHFGITRTHRVKSSALTVDGPGGIRMLLPKDQLTAPESAIEGSHKLFLLSSDGTKIELNPTVPEDSPSSPLAWVAISSDKQIASKHVDSNRFRRPTAPEDCLVIHRSRKSEPDEPSSLESAVMIESIGMHQLSDQGESWPTSVSRLDRDTWHGAVVLSAADEQIIGLLIINNEAAAIAKIPAALDN